MMFRRPGVGNGNGHGRGKANGQDKWDDWPADLAEWLEDD